MAVIAPPLTSPYLGDALSQLDGSAAQQHNCGLTVGSTLANAHTLGFWQVPPATLRTLSGVPVSSGTTYPQIIAAVKSGTKGEVNLTPLYWVGPQALDDALAAGRDVGVMINCKVTINTPYHTGTFTGLHELEVSAVRTITVTRADGSTYAQKQYLVMDPGKGPAYVTWVWWPAALLISAAKAATSNGTLLLLTTRDLTNVVRRCGSNGYIYSSGGTVAGKVVAGTSYTVVTTVRWSGYAANGHIAHGWNRLAVPAPGNVSGRSIR